MPQHALVDEYCGGTARLADPATLSSLGQVEAPGDDPISYVYPRAAGDELFISTVRDDGVRELWRVGRIREWSAGPAKTAVSRVHPSIRVLHDEEGDDDDDALAAEATMTAARPKSRDPAPTRAGVG